MIVRGYAPAAGILNGNSQRQGLRGHAYSDTTCGVRLMPKTQRPVLVPALAAVLASKLSKFNPDKPATYLIGCCCA